MFWEEPRVPGLPGAEDVTDGSVDYYDTDWENGGNAEMQCHSLHRPNNLLKKQTGTNRRTGV